MLSTLNARRCYANVIASLALFVALVSARLGISGTAATGGGLDVGLRDC